MSRDQIDQFLLGLRTKDGHASLPQPRRIERRVQAVRAQPRGRIQLAHPVDERRRQPSRGVHRQVESDDCGGDELLV